MNIPSPLPGRTFASTCVTSAWEASTCATSLNECEFSTIGNWNKGNHDFTNVVPALHLTLKWRENYLFPLYLFQLAVGHSSRTQNSFYLETKHRGPIIFPPCGHVIFSIFYVKQPKYANISRFTDCRKRYFHFQLAFDKSTLLIDSIQWLFSVVCLALNAGEQTATSNLCYLLFRLLF